MHRRTEKDNYDNWKHVGFMATVWRLLMAAPELHWHYMTLVAACLIAAAAYPGQALLMSRFIEVFQYTGSQMQKKGNFIALMFFVVGIGAFVVYFIIGWCSNTIATVRPLTQSSPPDQTCQTNHSVQGFGHKMRKQLVNDMLKQDLQFFDRPENTTGALTSRSDSYPQAIFELMGFNIALILTSVVSVLSCSILALAYGWRLGVVIVFAGLPPMLFAGYLRIRMESAMDTKISNRFSASASIASEAITAIRTVSSLSIEKSVLERYTDELDQANSSARRPILLIMLPFAFTQSVEYWFMALGFWYGCRLVSFGDLSMVNFFVAFLGVFFSGQQASVLFGFSSSMTKAVNAANYVFWLSELEPSIRETDDNRNIGPTNYSTLELDQIKFSYPMRPQARVLQGVNLSVKQGQFVAFVGASGCGKSTMIGILERFYDPVTGHLRIDGTDVDKMNPWLFRKDVALVQQKPVLYSGTIRHNISTGVPTEDPSLPDGLNTQCGSNGAQLSGGQRQRIAIARALIRTPRMLLLDEATSALDTQSERIVQEALNQAAASGEQITIAVAHRLSTIRHADVICVFHGGRIVEHGTHEQLLAKGQLYKKMCEAQSLGTCRLRDLPDHVWSYVFDQFEYPAGESSFATEDQFDGPDQESFTINPHRHPNLAQRVEKVNLGEGVFSRDEITSLLLPHYDENGDGAQSRPDGLKSALRGLLDGPEWPDAVPDIWFAHCAAILPNLKLLEYATRNEGTFLQAVIRQATAEAEASGPGGGPQTLEEEPRQHSPSRLNQPLSRLEEFRISNQDTEFATLKISWGSGTVGDSNLNFDDIGNVLREHGTGLEVLDLDCRECISYEMGESEGSLGSLRSLQRLKHLALPEAILLGDEDVLGGMDKVGDDSDDTNDDAEAGPVSTESLERLLPDELETLRLYSGYDEEAWVRDSVQGILASRRLGRLRKVRLDFATEIDEEWDLDGWGSEGGVDHCAFYR
ncbi:multidrug resistance protein 3 (p glycoprotein 3) [Colletotrichum musicola]|uniref:Multidrug resistance protein 3 (P glycoprotein 3) n=1 Tax=Colletotrichum musicola TaxID=2175873 RepID=A0A8H6IYI0_9PEZI|nr:multidrug resistance protein 3 (p glycoprotein 3) [Colletotrichum musicola]